jgi:hypothetical protein
VGGYKSPAVGRSQGGEKSMSHQQFKRDLRGINSGQTCLQFISTGLRGSNATELMLMLMLAQQRGVREINCSNAF